MCGRAALGMSDEELAAATKTSGLETSKDRPYMPSYNISPGSHTPVLVRRDNETVLRCMKWGITGQGDRFVINARSETIVDKRMFKSLVNNHRCIFLCIGFFEWQPVANTSKKNPMFIATTSPPSIMRLAGLWSPAKGSTDSDTFVVLTSDSCKQMSSIHDRMPVILDEAQAEDWLNCDTVPFEKCRPFLRPFQHKLVIYRVSPLQGKGANCIEPYAVAQERSRSQGILRYFKKADTVTGKRPREDDDNKTETPAPDK
ncbi:unnamed protein product (mitochondrion) [Plasmodiophora brassicae]|uniref:Abasic site processing protein HMCES n=1 Tax=Plasmodiophora brassicae TaxID=37360 RepID=A0A3P3YCI7_PLABS|nr:unnamed protein product [Plasmodiophora brassicae]